MTAPVIIGYDAGAPGGDICHAHIGPHILYCGDAYALLPRLGFFDAWVEQQQQKTAHA